MATWLYWCFFSVLFYSSTLLFFLFPNWCFPPFFLLPRSSCVFLLFPRLLLPLRSFRPGMKGVENSCLFLFFYSLLSVVFPFVFCFCFRFLLAFFYLLALSLKHRRNGGSLPFYLLTKEGAGKGKKKRKKERNSLILEWMEGCD